MSKYETAWNELKIAIIATDKQLREAIAKKDPNVPDVKTQTMMIQKFMYVINEIEIKTGIQDPTQIITP